MKSDFEQAKDSFLYKIKTLEEKNEKYKKDNMYLKKVNNSKDQDLIRLYKMDDLVQNSTSRIIETTMKKKELETNIKE